MTKIALLFDSTYGDTFYKGIADAFTEFGVDVFYVNVHGIETKFYDICKKIKFFNADLLINFNNFFPIEYKKYLPKKILTIDVDTPENFINKDDFINDIKLRKRYYSSIQSCYPQFLSKYFPEIKKELYTTNTFWLPPASNFKNVNLDFKRNIFFVGTNWNYGLYDVFNATNINILKLLYSYFENDYSFSVTEIAEKNGIKIPSYLNDFSFKWNVSGLRRVEFLSMLVDLGLEVYGDRWDLLKHNMDLLKVVKNKKILTPDELNYYYNSSKISVNFSHPQAISGFSFRCLDIMASASCILTEWKPDFEKIFGDSISKEVQDVIFYSDKFDLREKAKYLLSHEDFRLRCVKECNQAIEKNGRWVHRIEQILKYFGILNHQVKAKGKVLNYNKWLYLNDCKESREKLVNKENSNFLSSRFFYNFGDVIYFYGPNNNSLNYIVSGFSNSENNFTWSSAFNSELFFDLSMNKVFLNKIKIMIDYISFCDNQDVIIFVNSIKVAELNFNNSHKIEFEVPIDCIQDGKLSLLFFFPGAVIPADTSPESLDVRRISVAFKKMQLINFEG